MAIFRQNERSCAIEIITKINEVCLVNDLKIKCAGGELTVYGNGNDHMFPDVVLYGDNNKKVILQGWELKMPDVPIEDEALIRNAQKKAVTLGLNSFLIWNFTYAVLYERNDRGGFNIKKQWKNSRIRTRADVDTYVNEWKYLLGRIVIEINSYFVSGEFRFSDLTDVISTSAVASIIDRNKELVADELRQRSVENAVISAHVSSWWREVHAEYDKDEEDAYKAYAKSVLLNWSNRIIFAHLIKKRQNAAMEIDNINESTTTRQANAIFRRITANSDFFNIFNSMEYDEMLPNTTWADMKEFSSFIKEHGIEELDQDILQNVMEQSVSEARRCINGQYTTPKELANILVRLTVVNWKEPFMDCCCGTGTIAKAAIENKRAQMSPKDALESVWASDKNQYTLQIANISMCGADTINVANRIFKHNALNLRCGEGVRITNPETGDEMLIGLPEFGSIASNLPFVKNKDIVADDRDYIRDYIQERGLAERLGGRSDLYCYIAIKIADILKDGGRLGIITSNSWLGTEVGKNFIDVLKDIYTIKQVHISGCERWFTNAKVVTTILILEKRGNDVPASAACASPVDFFLWKSTIKEMESNKNKEDELISSALLGKEPSPDVAVVSRYNFEQAERIVVDCGVSYNSLFHNVSWLPEILDKLVKIGDVYEVTRGSRRGWDNLFYPECDEHDIERLFLRPVLKNARNVKRYDAVASDQAFCCSMSMEELEQNSYNGALQWIRRFEGQTNEKGKPLPQALSMPGMEWYELQQKEVVEVFTGMNPGKRLFFSKFDTPSFINQRLIGLKGKEMYNDSELNFALLNSLITVFYIEASGFGRGLGVLDINSDNIAACYMPNPHNFTEEQRDEILEKFNVLKERDIKGIEEELRLDDRVEFEMEVLRALGIEDYFDKIKRALLSMQKTRAAARGKA